MYAMFPKKTNRKAIEQFLFLIFFVLLSLTGSYPASAAPAGTALQFNGTNQYATFGNTAATRGTLTAAPIWQTAVNSKLGASSLLFNGTSQYVTFGAAPELGASNFTIETWFNWNGTGVPTTTGTGGLTAAIPLVTKGRGEGENSNVDMNYFLGISGGKLAADFEEGAGQPTPGLNHPVTGTTTITQNIWHHAAATYNSTTGVWYLYLDGIQDGTSTVGAGIQPRSDSIQHAGIGTAMTSTGAAAGFFGGRMDEARIWNVVRTQAEIQATMNSEILNPITGLLGRWGLNDGTGTTASNLNRLGVTTFTLEAWVKRTAGGVTMSTGNLGFDGVGGRPNGIYPVLVKGMGEGETPTNINTNWFLGITVDGFVGADFEDTAGGVNHPAWGTTNIPSGEWHHITATYTGSCWALFVDGNPETLNALVTACPNATPESTSYQYASLAASQSSTGTLGAGYFSGVIDEARIWNRALTPVEILANKYLELTSGSGLIGRWGMNEGSGTIINDSAIPTPENGTLVNGPIWVTGFPDNVPPAAPSGFTANSYSSNVNLGWTANSESDFVGYNLYRSTTAGGPYTKQNIALLTTTTYLDSGLANGTTYYYVLRAVDSSNNESTNTIEVSATPTLAQGAALQFNGSSQYVTFGTGNGLASPVYTVETWFKRTGPGAGITTGAGGIASAIPLITKGTSESETPATDINYFLGIDATSGVLVADFEEGAGGVSPSLNHPVSGTTVIANNTWYHAAMTYDGITLRIYLNGILENSITVGQPTASATTSPSAFGTSIRSNGTTIQGYFAGTLDEPRVWNRALTLSEIQTNVNSQLTSGANLLARWGMDEGLGTTISSSIGTFNGTLTNGPSWVPGAPFNIVIGAPSAPSGLNANAVNGTNIDLTWTDNSNNEATFEIERGSNIAGPFTPLVSVATNTANSTDAGLTPFTQYCYRVRAVNAGGPSAYSAVSCATTPSEGGEALKLGNASAYVIFPNSSSLNTSSYTIETWFRRDGTGIATTTGANGTLVEPLIAKGTAETEVATADINYIFGINPGGNTLCADFEEAAAGVTPSLNHPICGNTAIQNGIWYHAAATYDGTTWHLYLNGMPEASLIVSQPANIVNISPVSLGTSIQSDGTTTQGSFNGTLEEVRIWNYARTPAQILATVNSQITTAQSGLIARWGLNQNTGTLINGSAGTTVNGTITGTGYSWVTPGAPFNLDFSVPAAPSGLSATASFAYQTNLSWTDNSSNEVGFEIERGNTIAGPFTYLATAGVNATSYSDGTALPLTQFCYRVRAVNAGGQSTYSNASCTTTLAENGAALQLGSANAYAKFSNSATLNTANFTVETWFRRDGAGVGTDTGTGGIASAIPLVTKGTSEAENANADINYFLAIDSATNTLCADFEEAASGAAPSQNHPVCGTTPLVNGTWYHAAATYDGTTWKLYLNGLPEASLVVGQPANAVGTPPVALGTSIESNGNTTGGYFNGSLDEVRIWNYARTLAEIQSTVNAQIATAQTGLIARWSLNEDAGTVVHGSAGTAVNGVMSGTGYSWITPGAPFNIVLTPPVAPSALLATSPTAYQVNLTWTDNSNNETNFEIEKGSVLAGPFSLLTTLGINATTLADAAVFPTTQYCYRVRAINSVGPSTYSNVACITTLNESASALDFGTAHAYTTFGDANTLDLTQFTLEGWFRRDGVGTPNTTGTGGLASAVPLISNGSPEAETPNADINYLLCIDDATDTLCADFEEGAAGTNPGLNHPITGVTPITNGQWYHAAVTYDGTTWRLYLNGVLENQTVVNRPVNTANISATALATMLTTTNVANGFFDGAMDEVRIWNYSRTEAEIRSTLNTEITSPQSGLVARWGLSEGSGTTVGGTAGTTVNGTVTGAGYSWITPGAPFNVTFNAPPNVPTLITPPDNSANTTTSPVLSATVSDPNGGNLTVQFYGRPVNATVGSDFSIIAIPDTQYYTSALNGGSPAIFDTQTQWVVNNMAANNIQFVTQLGDCTEHGDQFIIEWQRADQFFQTIENPLTTGMPYGMPYGIAPGNHDETPIGTANGTTLYNQFFGESRFLGRDYYGGHYGTNNDNHYELFSASGMDFIVIHLAYDTTANPAVLNWANTTLQTYSTRRAIVVTHWLINGGNNATYSPQGQAIYNALKGNPNLFLMLGGHVPAPAEGQRSDTFNGNTVYSLMSDYQGRAAGGNGWLRIITISPANNNIQVKTYSPWLNQFETDADSQFTLPANLANSFQLIGTDTVASGGTASVTWPGLNNNTEYEWYAVASDGAASATSSTWSFTTEPPANVPPIITGQNPLATNEDTSLTITPADLTVVDPDNTYPTGFSLAVQNGTNYTVAGTTITPSLNFNGTLTVPVIVNDGTDNSNVFNLNVTVTPINDLPTTTGIPNIAVNEDAPNTTIDLWPSFADVETTDNLLTYTVTTNTNPSLFTSTTVAAGQNLVIDYAPNVYGSAQLTIRATDVGVPVQFIETTFTVTVAPVNDPPTTSGIANLTVNEDAPNSTIDLWPSFADIENADNLLIYTFTVDTNPTLFTSVAVNAGQNLVLDYAPNLNGSSQITVRATDLDGGFIETSFTVTVSPVNDVPTCVNVVATTLEDTAVQSDPSCTDADGNTLTYSIVAQPLSGTASVVAGKLVYMPNANYNGADSYTYKANDGTADGNTATVNVTVTAQNDTPVATPQTLSTAEDTSLPITLSGSDVENSPLTFTVVTPPANGVLSGTGANLTYTPASNYNGPDSFTFRVNDGTIDSSIATISITVTAANDAPVAVGEAYSTAEDTALTITLPGVLGNDSDPENNTLTAVKVTNPANGTVTVNANGSFTYNPNANFNGPDSFTYKANDGLLDSNIVTVNITVSATNDTPVATPQTLTTPEETALAITLSGTDVENSPLTYAVITPPSNGSLTGTEPNLVYTPNSNYNGPDSFTFRVNDGTVNSPIATISLTVTPLNDAPVAIGESYTSPENTALNIVTPGVLGNDQDLDGNPLTAILVTNPTNGTLTLNSNGSFTYTPNQYYNGPDSFTYKANDGTADSNTVTVTINVSSVNNSPACVNVALTTNEDVTGQVAPSCVDADGDAMTYSVMTQPTNGTASILTGQLVYVPNGNFNGTDSFTYRASDGVLNGNISTVSVTVVAVNDAPAATPQVVTTAEETSVNITLSGSDIEGSTLTFAIATPPTNGTLSGTAPNITYTPNTNYNGPDSFTFTANDALLNSTPATISINVTAANDAPVATPQTVSTAEDTALNITLSGNDVDADPLTFNILTPPANGTLSGAAPNITYTPNADYNGPDAFTFLVNDGTVNSAPATITITVTAVNDAPTAAAESYTTNEDTTLTVAAPGVLSNDIDKESNPLTAVLVTGPANGTLTLNANGSLSYTPNVNINGADSFTYRANDGLVNGNIATVTINITATNDAPVFTSAPVLAAAQGTAYNYAITTNDPDGTPLTITAQTLPAWLALVDNGNGTASLAGTPSNADVGANNITLRVSDGTLSTDQVFVITVSNTNDAPSFTSAPVTTATEDSLYIYNVTTFDADLGDVLSITAPTLPAWLTLSDNGNGTATLSGTPLNAHVGSNSVTLRVNDGTVNVNQVFAITVTNTNDMPTDIALSNNLVDEGLPAGTFVGNLTASDPDTGDTFTYSLCGGPDDAFFQIAGSTLETAAILNVNTQSTYTVCVRAQDAGGLFIDKQFTININNVNDAPVITLQSSTKNVNESTPLFFDAANASTIVISDPDAGSGNLSVTISVTHGTLTLSTTAGLTVTPPADGSADTSITFAGTLTAINAALNGMRYDPFAGFNGGDTLQITADDLGNTGLGTNQTDSASMTFNITATPPKIVSNGINSVADTGDGILSESEIVTVGINQFIITFDQNVNDPTGDTDPADVTNPVNYKLINDNGNGFQTTSCASGVNPQDNSITVNSVSYDNHSGSGPFVATLNVNDGLPLAYGNYRLFICGTTSITDIYGLKLAGDGINAGTDMTRSFIVINSSGGGGGSTNNSSPANFSITGVLIPVTGYAPHVAATIPAQPAEESYNTMNTLRLEIPSLSINRPIVGVQFKNKGWDVRWLEDSIGYLEGSAYPTWTGNSVLTGHATDANGNLTNFGYISELAAGEKIMVHSNGLIYIYQVKENRLISPSSIDTLFKHQDYSWITMVTCENYNDDIGKYTSRRMVRAVLISVIPEQ